jgi:hypothetical protein
MDTSQRWIERLFGRLQVRYGSGWNSMWEGIEPEAVKADWVETLHTVFERNPTAIAYALEHLPDRCPTSDQFRRICNLAPLPEAKRLPEPPADKARVAAALAAIVKPTPAKQSPAEVCAAGLRKKLADGMHLTLPQREMLAACERVQPPEAETFAGFNPIPADALPPGMRDGMAEIIGDVAA